MYFESFAGYSWPSMKSVTDFCENAFSICSRFYQSLPLSRLSHNARMSRKQAGEVCKPFFGTKNMNEKKFRKNFSQNSSGQQNVTFFWGSERKKRNFQVCFIFCLEMEN